MNIPAAIVTNHSKLFPQMPRIIRNSPEQSKSFQNPLECSRTLWNLLEFSRRKWKHLEDPGSFWNSVEACRALWRILEYSGIFQNSLEYCKQLQRLVEYSRESIVTVRSNRSQPSIEEVELVYIGLTTSHFQPTKVRELCKDL